MARKSKPTQTTATTAPASGPKDLATIVADVAVYPIEAYEFVQHGLNHAVTAVHGPLPEHLDGKVPKLDDPEVISRHVSGRQLCLGLRDFAWERWGLLARTVLGRWNITSTNDFGRIVFAMIDAGVFSKTDSDRPEDFRDVYDFATLETADVTPLPPSPLARHRPGR
jgi:uncharacterized repeat protein (TIGR04138 family)